MPVDGVPSNRALPTLVALVSVPVLVAGSLIVVAAMRGTGSTNSLLFGVLGLVSVLVPVVALYLLARIAGELGRIADALEADGGRPEACEE